jgi:phosphoribosylformimino-5-aminoimidazole carboxamide ribotide isomerase
MGFRPCIDLRNGRVVQIVGGSLTGDEGAIKVNFETGLSPAYYANMYKEDNLKGGHVISLGQGNHDAAISALKAYPGGLQVGGGITPDNAMEYLEAGASHVIVTSYLFTE